MGSFYLQGDDPTKACRNCGNTSHMARECDQLPCNFCKKHGHIITNCPKVPPCGISGKKGHKTERCRNRSKGGSLRGINSISHSTQRRRTPYSRHIVQTSSMHSTQISSPGCSYPEYNIVQKKESPCMGPENSQKPSDTEPTIQFPRLYSIILHLLKNLQGDFGQDLYFRHIPYNKVIGLFESPESLTEILVNSIEPTIQGLEGMTITRTLLENVRIKQQEDRIQWSLNSGYMDYVTDDRDLEYWRPYIGQSNNPKHRIAQHIRAIRSGDTNTLHYYIISKGEGYRRANFLKLWTLTLPDGIDTMVYITLNNVLEMVMARAFQSLAPGLLLDSFGPSNDGLPYIFKGLNIMPPLLQGRSLSPSIRHQYTVQLQNSIDEEIRAWPQIRMSQKDGCEQNYRIKPFTRITKGDCQKALQEVCFQFPELQISGDILQNRGPTGLQEDLPTFDWLQRRLIEAYHEDTNNREIFLPVGNLYAYIGIIIGEFGWDRDTSLPWGLEGNGFSKSNCLTWTSTFLQIHSILPGDQLNVENSSRIKICHQMNWELLQQSRLKIVLLCDTETPKILFDNLPFIRATEIVLQDHKFKIWLEVQGGCIQRIYIASPAPLSTLWSNNWKQAIQLSILFQFSALVTNTEGIRYNNYSNQLVLLQIIRQYDDERNSLTEMTICNIDSNIRAWLHSKGFKNDNDISRLESAGGSLTCAIMMLTVVQRARSEPYSSRLPRKLFPKSKEKRRDLVFDRTKLDKINDLVNKVSNRDGHATSPKSGFERTGTNPMDKTGQNLNTDIVCKARESMNTDFMGEIEMLLESQEEMQRDILETDMITLDDKTTPSIERNTNKSHDRIRERRIKKFYDEALRIRFRLGTAMSNVWAQGKEERKLYRAYAFYIQLHFHLDGEIQASFPKTKGPDQAMIKVDIKPPGEKHPHRWSPPCRDDDPAARLAFLLTLRGEDGIKHSFYAKCKNGTEKSIKKANSFVDWMAGEKDEVIATKPRRFLYIRVMAKTQYVPPVLRPFTDGGYTDDEGNVISVDCREKK